MSFYINFNRGNTISILAIALGFSGCDLAMQPLTGEKESEGNSIQMNQAMAGRQSKGGMKSFSSYFRNTHHPRHHGENEISTQVLLDESWNLFDELIWEGDGDQKIDQGRFTAEQGTGSAVADWRPANPILLSEDVSVVFSNHLVMDGDFGSDPFTREALFFVSGDTGTSMENFVFLFVQYSQILGTVSLESFGANGGIDFDQYLEMEWAAPSIEGLLVDIVSTNSAFQIRLNGEKVDSIHLNVPLHALTVFEVGVQESEGGAIGLIDKTVVSLTSKSQSNPNQPCKLKKKMHSMHHKSFVNFKRQKMVNLVRNKILHGSHVGCGQKILARMKD